MALRAVGAAVLALLVAACAEERVEVQRHPGVLMAITIETGHGVIESHELVATLAGDLVPSNPLLRDASCQNMQDWTNDVTLDNRIVVATSRGSSAPQNSLSRACFRLS